jgi:hypothetical protein
MASKNAYRVSNWKAYNRSLINRGNLTIWFDESALSNWYNQEMTGKKGRSRIYSDQAIECALVLRQLFRFPLRATQGFLEGMIHMMSLDIVAPTYSTLCRRAAEMSIALGNLDPNKAVHVVIDATGLKVYGEGEWHTRTHGKSKRRTWRKLHIAIDRETHEIISMVLTESNVHDSKATTELLDQVSKIETVTGDKGYDNRNAYDPIAARAARAIIPPRSGAALKLTNPSWGDVERNRNILEKHFIGGELWKYKSGYTRRSLVETAIGRYKQIIGPRLHGKNIANQKTEVRIGAKILNQMTQLGMPKSYKL